MNVRVDYDFYGRFGPRMLEEVINLLVENHNNLMDGITRLVLSELNVLRAQHNMTELTFDQLIAALEDDIGRADSTVMLEQLKDIWAVLPHYDRMDD